MSAPDATAQLQAAQIRELQLEAHRVRCLLSAFEVMLLSTTRDYRLLAGRVRELAVRQDAVSVPSNVPDDEIDVAQDELRRLVERLENLADRVEAREPTGAPSV